MHSGSLLLQRLVRWTVPAMLILPLAACSPAASPAVTSTLAPTGAPAKATAAPPTPSPAAPAKTSAPTPAPVAGQKVRLGSAGTIGDAIWYIAQEKGYFKEAGLDIEMSSFAGGGDVMAPLSAGQLDVAAGGVNLGTFNAVARNIPITIVADRAYATPGADSNIWMVRSDLTGQIKSVADLKGRKVAINTASSPLVYMVGKALEKRGLKLDDVEIVTIAFPDMIAAFENKAIDVAIEVEPYVVRAEDLGVAKTWMEASQEVGPMETGVVFFNTDWAKKNPTAAASFMKAFLKGARTYYQAIKGGSTRAEVVGILTRNTSLKDPALYEKLHWSGLNPDGYIDIASVQDQIDWYYQRGYLKDQLSAQQVVDHTYLDAALRDLGKYQQP